MAIGILVCNKVVKGGSYIRALQLTEPKSESQRTKRNKKDKESFSRRLAQLKHINEGMILSVIVSVIASVFLITYQGFGLYQMPLFLFGSVASIAIFFYFTLNDKKAIDKRLRVNLRVFIILTYILMAYAFIDALFYLYVYSPLRLYESSVIASLMVAVVFACSEYVITMVRKSIIFSIKADEQKSVDSANNQKSRKKPEPLPKSIPAIFAKYSNLNSLIGLSAVVILCDAPMVYSIVVEQNLQIMLSWTQPFFIFFLGYAISTFANNLEFQINTDLLNRSDLMKKIRKIV